MLNRKPMLLVMAGPNGSGKSSIAQYFEKVGTYTNADDMVAATGMDNRDAAGGHDVDEQKTRDRYYKSLRNIKKLLELCDIMHIYDNTDVPRRIVRKYKDDLSLFPNEFWTEESIKGLLY